MPIDVKELFSKQNDENKIKNDVKFFSQELKGNSRTDRGVLYKDRKFANPDTLLPDPIVTGNVIQKKELNADFSIKYFPTNPFKYLYLFDGEEFTNLKTSLKEDDHFLFEVNGIKVYLRSYAGAILIQSPKGDYAVKNKMLCVTYNYEIIVENGDKVFIANVFEASNKNELIYHIDKIIENLYGVVIAGDYKPQLEENLNKYLEAQNLYDDFSKMAQIWKESMPKYIVHQLNEKGILKGLDTFKSRKENQDIAYKVSILTKMIEALTNYTIDSDDYLQIYNFIKDKVSKPAMDILCARNSFFSIFEYIWELLKIKPELHSIKDLNLELPENVPISDEQKEAILTKEPLVIIQAGAGTGKTHTIINRIDTLIRAGVDPKDILPISFTRVGASNINKRYPEINSMTLSSYMNTIYQHNYPTQQLVEPITLANMIPVRFKNNNVAGKLVDILKQADNRYGESKATIIELSAFILENREAVEEILNTLMMTTLAIQTIFCYLFISDLDVPDTIPKHLIIDESQDNSIFDNVFAIRFTIRFKNNLYFVGDASQTLYEFRSSDPTLLNTIEGSDVFACYKLTQNYRSKQEILQSVNPLLLSIDANKHAQIELSSAVDDDIFKSAEEIDQIIKVKNIQVSAPTKKINSMLNYEESGYEDFYQDVEFVNFMSDILMSGEQALFLAHTRRNAYQLKELIEHFTAKINGKASVVRPLMTPTPKSHSLISSFISKNFQNLTMTTQPNSLIPALIAGLKRYMDKYIRYVIHSKNAKKEEEYLTNYINRLEADLNKKMKPLFSVSLVKQVPAEKIQNAIVDFALDFEIVENNIASLLSNKNSNESLISDDVQFYVSTIHSAKGLEFDNVFYVTNIDKLNQEESKRETYVAMTRSKKREYIYAVTKFPSNPFGVIVEELTGRTEF